VENLDFKFMNGRSIKRYDIPEMQMVNIITDEYAKPFIATSDCKLK
jgi:hypothetical protein